MGYNLGFYFTSDPFTFWNSWEKSLAPFFGAHIYCLASTWMCKSDGKPSEASEIWFRQRTVQLESSSEQIHTPFF